MSNKSFSKIGKFNTKALSVAEASSPAKIAETVDKLDERLVVVENTAQAGAGLGTHIASQDLDMASFAVINVGNVDGIDVSALDSSVTEIDANVNDLISLSGVAENATDLGTFSGSTIADTVDIKAALQAIETALELGSDDQDASEVPFTPLVLADWDGNADPGSTKDALDQLAERVDDNEIAISPNTTHSSGDGSDHQDVIDLVSLSGVAANASDLGTFSGSTIADTQDVKAALQALETEVELKETSVVVSEIDVNVNDLISLSGVAENASDLGAFSGATIPDTQDIKAALQALETALELGSDDQTAAEVPFTPLVLADWDGDADPGSAKDALDQLAERVDDNEIAIAADLGGDVVSAGASTDHALARFDLTSGKIIQNSLAILDDSGNLSGLVNVDASGNFDGAAYEVASTKVVGAQGAAVADGAVTTTVGANTGSSGAGLTAIGDTSSVDQSAALMNDLVALQEDILDIKTQLNLVLAKIRTHGLIAT